jgi:hypothetical protein
MASENEVAVAPAPARLEAERLKVQSPPASLAPAELQQRESSGLVEQQRLFARLRGR